jgi:hypothetical protein
MVVYQGVHTSLYMREFCGIEGECEPEGWLGVIRDGWGSSLMAHHFISRGCDECCSAPR